jgi:hypothetical protein
MIEWIGLICLLAIGLAALYLRTLIRQSVESEVRSVLAASDSSARLAAKQTMVHDG